MNIIGKLIIGILRVAGLIAAPFTFGTGIVVSIVRAGIGGAGEWSCLVPKSLR